MSCNGSQFRDHSLTDKRLSHSWRIQAGVFELACLELLGRAVHNPSLVALGLSEGWRLQTVCRSFQRLCNLWFLPPPPPPPPPPPFALRESIFHSPPFVGDDWSHFVLLENHVSSSKQKRNLHRDRWWMVPNKMSSTSWNNLHLLELNKHSLSLLLKNIL